MIGIKQTNMPLPESCDKCRISEYLDTKNLYCQFINDTLPLESAIYGRHKDCPLIEVNNNAYWQEMMDHFICSNCDCEINDTHSIEYSCKWNYCPNCGSKMTKIVGMHGEEYEV